MNETNRLLIVFVAAAWIVAMAAIIFVTWAAPENAIDRLGDMVEFLDDNNTDAGKAIITLAALAAAILGLLVIILELGPEDEVKDLRVEQAGATTIVPADALRQRLEEALTALPNVTAAKTKVWTRDKGIAAAVNVTVTPDASAANVTQEAARVIVDTVQTDLGLPVSGVPEVRITFGGPKPAEQPLHAVAPEPDIERVETVDERISGVPETTPAPAAELSREPEPAPPPASEHEWRPASRANPPAPEPEAHADSSPGPLIYDEGPSETAPDTTETPDSGQAPQT